jgi:dihydrodipicolinate synthase/N-acetylneuraminate lyase
MDRQAMIQRLRGCYLATPTPFKDDLSLDLDALRRYVRFLVGSGFRTGNATILINGAVGEFPVLSLEERKQTAEAAVREAGARIAIIVGAQTPSTRDAVEIARHAQAIGATALQVSPPFYYPPSDDDVYEHFAAIAEAAPELGIVVYTTYWLGYRMSLDMLARLAEIPQVAAVKWAAPDALEYQLGHRRLGSILGMIDNQLTPVFGMLLGGSGCNVHPALFWPEWGLRLWSLFETQQWGEAQAEVTRVLIPYYELFHDIAAYSGGEGHSDKLALELLGLPGGRNRPPTRALPPVFKVRLQRYLEQIGAPLNRV